MYRSCSLRAKPTYAIVIYNIDTKPTYIIMFCKINLLVEKKEILMADFNDYLQWRVY